MKANKGELQGARIEGWLRDPVKMQRFSWSVEVRDLFYCMGAGLKHCWECSGGSRVPHTFPGGMGLLVLARVRTHQKGSLLPP